MVGRQAVLKGIGMLFIGILVFFVALFFYGYLTGGGTGVLALLARESIGVLLVEGAIDDTREAIGALKRFGDMSGIKAVVLRIDSPGGGVAPTQELYEEIEKLKKKKPVVASLGGVAASGGYYIASACNQIVANPGTITGSIGVVIELGNVEELMQKIGLKGYSIKSAPHKDMGSPLRSLSAKERDIFQSLVDNVHAQFVRAVAKGRNMSEAKVQGLADGSIYSGEQAKSLGLVDVLGNMEDAVDLVAQRVGIKGTPQLIFAQSRQTRWWEEVLFSLFNRPARLPAWSWGLRYEWSPYAF